MVMTLRKRVPPVSMVVANDSDTESEYVPRKKAQKITKPIKTRENFSFDSDSNSDSDKENDASIEYEKFREQRIRENKERLEKLGIFSLSSQLFNANNKKGVVRRKNPAPKKKRYPPLYPQPRSRSCDSFRRSDRLKNVPRSQYVETEGTLKDMGISIPDGWKAEVYTEEDEKLLGDCETKWTLNTDGFGEDGERLYDPDGKPCHQCRQKTLGKLTNCGKCRSPQGNLCGDCLCIRYGENVLEAVENPTWLCPACRDICNCSRCRRTKGWDPINIPYSKVIASGFKSVAHYLILSRRAGATPKELKDDESVIDLSVEETAKPEQHEVSDYSAESSEYDSDDSDSDDDSKGAKKIKDQSGHNQVDSAVAADQLHLDSTVQNV